MRNLKQTIIYICIFAGIILGVFGIANAVFNEQINFQGKLTDNNNLAVPDGNYNFEFSLYATDTAGSAIWTETATDTNKIVITNGLFSHLLGSISSLSSVDFNQILWLEVKVGGTSTSPSWETLSPRKKLGAVPAAFEAKKLGGKEESAFGTLSENETVVGEWSFNNILSIASSSASTTLTITQNGAGSIIDFKNATGSVFVINNSGNITTGTWEATPIGSTYGGTGTSTASWTGVPYITAGVWGTTTDSDTNYYGPTIIVAASNSTNTDRAHYVCDGTNDEAEINQALAALPSTGGVVQLLEGTYTVGTSTYSDCSIKMSTSTALVGVGVSTIIQLKNAFNASLDGIICNSDTTNGNSEITISNLKIDGKKASTTGAQTGIYFNNVGSGTGTAAVAGAKIENVYIENSDYAGMELYYTNNSFIVGNTVINSDSDGIWLATSSNNVISDNTVRGNSYGIGLGDYSNNNNVVNNIVEENWNYGIYVYGVFGDSAYNAYDNIISGNNIISNGDEGVYLYSAINNIVSDNVVQKSESYGINVVYGKGNSLISNTVGNSVSLGIYIQSSSTLVSENIVYAGDWDGIYVIEPYNIISNNIVENHDGGYGINIDSAASYTIISDNLVQNNDWSGILVDSNSNTITGNKVHENGDSNDAPGIGIAGNLNLVSSNEITGSSGNGNAIEVGGDYNYFDGNRYSGSGAYSIEDTGTGNTIQHRDQFEVEASTTLTALTVSQTGTGTIANFSNATGSVFTIINNGNVGIGTTSPSALLEVFSSNSSASGLFRVATGTTEGLYIDSAGNIGIGTVGPEAKLHVLSAGDNSNPGKIIFEQADTGVGVGEPVNEIEFKTNDGGGIVSSIRTIAGQSFYSGNTGGNLEFRTTPIGTATPTTKMTILSTGNVGIGTTTPAYTLDIYDGTIGLPITVSTNTGVIYKDGYSFLHDFESIGSTGFNTFLGKNAGNFTMSTGTIGVNRASYNTGIGQDALSSLTTGFYNTGIGYDALNSNTSGYQNTALGYHALENNTIGYNNVAVGTNALIDNTEGLDNIGIGYHAISQATSGNYNIGIGRNAGMNNQSGDANTIVGYQAGMGTEDVSAYGYNSLFGYKAGFSLTTGSRNLLLGYNVGNNLTTGDDNIMIGYNLDAPASNTSDFLSIGDTIYGDLSAGYVGIGTTTPATTLTVYGTTTLMGGNVGIGTTIPGYPLDVQSSQAVVQIKSLTTTNPAYTRYVNGNTFHIGVEGASGGVISPSGTTPYAGVLNMPSAYPLQFGTNDTLRMTIASSGEVGIGTTTPAALLDVWASSTANALTVTQVASGNIADLKYGATSLFTLKSADQLELRSGLVQTWGNFNDKIIDDFEDNDVSDWASFGTSPISATTTYVRVNDYAAAITTGVGASNNDTATTSISNEDWSGYEKLSFWIRFGYTTTSTEATTTQIISVQFNDTASGTQTHNVTIQKEGKWQYEEWDISSISSVGRDVVDWMGFKIDNDYGSPRFYIDQIRLYGADLQTAEIFVDAQGNAVFWGQESVEIGRTTSGGSLPSIKIDSAVVELNQPLSVNVGGDVGFDYDLQFLSTGLSTISSEGPLQIVAGDQNHYENLTLATGGTGDIIMDIASSTIGLKVLGSATSSFGAYVFRVSSSGAMEIGNDLTIAGDVLPASSTTYDLGSTTYKWRNVYVADKVLESLVLDLTLGENTGTTTADRSGWGNDGTLGDGVTATSMPSWTVGKVGYGLEFDGSDDYGVEVANSESLNITDAITIEMWAYYASDYAAPYDALFSIGTISEGYAASIEDNNMIWFYTDGTSGAWNWYTGQAVSVGQWTHLAFVYDGSAKYLYMDGIFSTSSNSTGTMSTTTGSLRIGASYAGVPNYPFPGAIDEFRIYSRALTAKEIQARYSEGIKHLVGDYFEMTGTASTSASTSATALTVTQNGTGTIVNFNNATGSVFAINNSGAVATGTWEAAPIGSTYGGTGTSTASWTGIPYITAGEWGTTSVSGGTDTDWTISSSTMYATDTINTLELLENGNLDGVGQVTTSTDPGSDIPNMIEPTAIYVAGDYAYVPSSVGNSLSIIDISDPANPDGVGEVTQSDPDISNMDYPKGIYVSGNYAYVTGRSSDALVVIDVSDPTNPDGVGQVTKSDSDIPNMDYPYYVYVSGNYAYVISSTGSSLDIIDISDPTNPDGVGEIASSSDSDISLWSPRSVYVSGNYAYVVSAGGGLGSLDIIDISDPTNPDGVGSVTSSDPQINIPYPSDVQVSGNYAYVTSVGGGGTDSFNVIDISDPANPDGVGTVTAADAEITSMDSPRSIQIAGNYAYVVSSDGDSLVVIDISDPANPDGITEITTSTDSDISGMVAPWGVSVSGNYAYVVGADGDALCAIKITGAKLPAAEIGSLKADRLQVMDNLQVDNDVYVQGGLSAINAYFSGDVGIYDSGSTTALTIIQSGLGNIIDIKNATGSVFTINNNGNVGIGTTTPAYKLVVIDPNYQTLPSSTPTIMAIGSTDGLTTGVSIRARGTITGGLADIGEYVKVMGNPEDYEQGDLLRVGPESGKFSKTQNSYESALSGVISDTPGIVAGGGQDDLSQHRIMALVGQVSVKVSIENGPIETNDYLTSSNIPGVAMKAIEPGMVIGMALESFENEEVGEIIVFINPHWSIGHLSEDGLISFSTSSVVTTTDIINTEQISEEASLIDQFIINIKNVLKKLGLFVENGVAEVKKLVTNVIQTGEIEMIDQATGEIYCTWIENGEWVKIKGECSEELTVEDPQVQACHPSEEFCDGVDNDCDELIDEEGVCEQTTTTEPIATTTDPLATTTEPTCHPSEEFCDGVDNDCDELIDEDLSQQCGLTDIGICQFGTQVCELGIWTECIDAIEPIEETCQDELDNDCNGEIDENCEAEEIPEEEITTTTESTATPTSQ
ncbi:right-handed parallel beta-helix repeat-containing protein [Patescibacteria group bacterium]